MLILFQVLLEILFRFLLCMDKVSIIILMVNLFLLILMMYFTLMQNQTMESMR
ncbi:hypothetical protein HanHA300_Chr16g0622571 [Helianthus annuus]|nr:hypothetical protein HanHA300_Chr16g0622571 [Helianthus annuus]